MIEFAAFWILSLFQQYSAFLRREGNDMEGVVEFLKIVDEACTAESQKIGIKQFLLSRGSKMSKVKFAQ